MEEKVLQILEEISGTDEVREDLDLDMFEAGLLDSLGTMELLMKIESVFGIRLQPTEVDRNEISSVNKIVELLNKRGL